MGAEALSCDNIAAKNESQQKRRGHMSTEEKPKTQKKYVYVKDADGIEYVCRLEDLKRADQLTEEEKEKCMSPPGDA
jgi:hypothetical protein